MRIRVSQKNQSVFRIKNRSASTLVREGLQLRRNYRRFVDGVEKQTDLSEVAFLGHEDDAGHVAEVVVVGLLLECGCLVDAA